MRILQFRHITLLALLSWSANVAVIAEELEKEKVIGRVGDKLVVQIGSDIVYKELPLALQELPKNQDKVLSIIGDKVVVQSGNQLQLLGAGMMTSNGQNITRIDDKGVILATQSGHWQYYTRPGVTLKKRTLKKATTKLSCDEGREKIQACYKNEQYLEYFTNACLAIQDNDEDSFNKAKKGMNLFKNALSTPTVLSCLNDVSDNKPPKIDDYITWK